MQRSIRSVLLVGALIFLAMVGMTTPAMSEGGGPSHKDMISTCRLPT